METKVTKPEDIELRSDEVQEILNHTPNSLIRWGSFVFFAITFVVFTATWFVKYPDTLPAKIMLVTASPPIHLMAQSSGRIRLQVKDHQKVQKNQLLGTIHNPASLDDVLSIMDWTQKTKPLIYENPIPLEEVALLEPKDLGDLQESYLSLHTSIENAIRFKQIDLLEGQRVSILSRVHYYQKLNEGLDAQNQILAEQLEISKTKYKDDSLLFKGGYGTKQEMMSAKNLVLQNRLKLESNKAAMVENRILASQLTAQADELRLRRLEEWDKLRTKVIENFEKFESQISSWKQKNMLVSPIDGQISFSKFWSNDQFVNQHEEVLSVVPSSQQIIGKIQLPIQRSGKVKPGQKIKIRFDNYPSSEFGMVIGQVKSISLVPINDQYDIQISLPHGLTTTYRKNLEFKQEMTGQAEIVTEERRLIERFFSQIRKLVDNATH